MTAILTTTETTRAQDALTRANERVTQASADVTRGDAQRLLVVVNMIPTGVVDYSLRSKLTSYYDGKTPVQPMTVAVADLAAQLAVLADAYSDELNKAEKLRDELRETRRDIAAVRRVFGTAVGDEL